jgi:glycogen(starch) synthase
MELLLITRSIYPLHGYGGMERHCYDWVLTMTQLGCRVHVITTPPLEPSSLSRFPQTVRFYFIPGISARTVLQRLIRYPLWIKRVNLFLQRFLKTAQPDAIYAQGLAVAACEHSTVPVFYNPHGMEEFKTSGLKYLAYARFRRLSRRGARTATSVIATDRSLIQEIITFIKVPRERIVLIPNAVQTEIEIGTAEVSKIAERFDAEHSEPVFVAAGRLESNKGFDVLIQALAQTSGLSPSWKLILAGTGSKLISLQKLARHCELSEKVHFAGYLSEDQLIALLEISDVFVNPTRYEGSSIITLEAMRQGLPVIATETGGLPDKVRPDFNGWLVPPNDSRALAEALEDAASKKKDWKVMGENSKRIIAANYTWEIVGPQYLALFKKGQYS